MKSAIDKAVTGFSDILKRTAELTRRESVCSLTTDTLGEILLDTGAKPCVQKYRYKRREMDAFVMAWRLPNETGVMILYGRARAQRFEFVPRLPGAREWAVWMERARREFNHSLEHAA